MTNKPLPLYHYCRRTPIANYYPQNPIYVLQNKPRFGKYYRLIPVTIAVASQLIRINLHIRRRTLKTGLTYRDMGLAFPDIHILMNAEYL